MAEQNRTAEQIARMVPRSIFFGVVEIEGARVVDCMTNWPCRDDSAMSHDHVPVATFTVHRSDSAGTSSVSWP